MTHAFVGVEQVLQRLREMGKNPKRYRTGWMALCPAHDDHEPSLSLAARAVGDNGAAVLHCFAGCRYEDIMRALGFASGQGSAFDTTPAGPKRNDVEGAKLPPSKIVATYDYHNEQGRLVYQVLRLHPKTFRCRRPAGPSENPTGAWRWGDMHKVRRVLYRLPEVLRAVALKQTVYVVEGEKDADRLAHRGLCATTNPHGALKWSDDYSASLRGAHVCIIPDNDQPGERHAQQVFESLRTQASSVKIVRLPGLPPKADVSDWLDAGATREDLERLCGDSANDDSPKEDRSASNRVPATVSAEGANGNSPPNGRGNSPPNVNGDSPYVSGDSPPPLTDLFHARQIAQKFGHNIRYCEQLGGFIIWDGRRWARDDTGQAWRWAVETVQALRREAADIDDDKRRAAVFEWTCKSESSHRIEAALRQLQAVEGIAVRPEAFDRSPHLLNCANGTVDLHHMSLREHRREDMLTRITDIAFRKFDYSPAWNAFLERIMGGNIELMAFVQRLCGYALTGHTSEQKLFFLHGSGANGKSTFLNALLHVWGEYGRRMPPDLLFADRRDTHPTALATLQGVRLAVTAEVEQGKRLAEVLVKELTGGDRLTARRMRQDYFEFEPTHKVLLAGNHLPIIRGADHAIWRRIDLLPFRVQIPEGEQDRSLGEKLRAEAEGLLSWCVTGAFDWHRLGLMAPAEVKAATGAYRSDMDVLGDFLADCTKIEPGSQTTSAAVSRAYAKWCDKNGERPMSARALGMRLKERGYEQRLEGPRRVRSWQNLALIEDEPLL